MKLFVYGSCLLMLLSSCGVQYHLHSEEPPEDMSYVYALPYPRGTSHLLVQGYNSKLSHKGRLALDFKMKTGSPVAAAREGIVVRVVQDYTKGGLRRKYLQKGNNVVVRHSDGTQAYYNHLMHNGALVHVGDSVKQGQVIAKSGSTGFSAFPHLHFMVWGPVQDNGRRTVLPTQFYTRRGAQYLRPGRLYRSL